MRRWILLLPLFLLGCDSASPPTVTPDPALNAAQTALPGLFRPRSPAAITATQAAAATEIVYIHATGTALVATLTATAP